MRFIDVIPKVNIVADLRLLRATAISCEARLALNANKPIEPGTILLEGYLNSNQQN